jgi:hypothetical protein
LPRHTLDPGLDEAIEETMNNMSAFPLYQQEHSFSALLLFFFYFILNLVLYIISLRLFHLYSLVSIYIGVHHELSPWYQL